MDIQNMEGDTTQLVRPDDEQMCCCKCGPIAGIGDAYETDYESDEEWPICPKCGNTNTGGYSCYAKAMYWQAEDMEWIIELNRGG